MLPDSTLTTKIREETWKLKDLYPLLKTTKQELKKLTKEIRSNIHAVVKLYPVISKLATEIRISVKELKFINFYDSTILYLYYKLLNHLLEVCKKEHERLKEESEKALLDETNLKGKKDLKKIRKDIEKKINEYKKVIRGLDVGENELVKTGAILVNKLRKLKWKTEKQAQHEFSFGKLSFRGIENLTRKIKVGAISVKNEVTSQQIDLMKKVNQGQVDPKDIVTLARLVAEGIEKISDNVAYSAKLISKFENEKKKLHKLVEKLKKMIKKNKEINKKTAKRIMGPWDEAIRYEEREIDKDLMQIFRNIFVEYKYVGTRQPK
jgi:hypothetical protein|tara:strand:- start:51131 stop:52096 length:966 start_codon:yes stop_codon:yes gene_type:complete